MNLKPYRMDICVYQKYVRNTAVRWECSNYVAFLRKAATITDLEMKTVTNYISHTSSTWYCVTLWVPLPGFWMEYSVLLHHYSVNSDSCTPWRLFCHLCLWIPDQQEPVDIWGVSFCHRRVEEDVKHLCGMLHVLAFLPLDDVLERRSCLPLWRHSRVTRVTWRCPRRSCLPLWRHSRRTRVTCWCPRRSCLPLWRHSRVTRVTWWCPRRSCLPRWWHTRRTRIIY